MLAATLLATFLISLGGLLGTISLSLNKKFLEQILILLVSLSAGTFMGGAFLHLLPEAVAESDPELVFALALGAFIVFFLIEKVLQWRHCHEPDCERHTVGYMNLVGDAVHNFIDGLVIAAAFATGPELGWVTALAVALHEIPQELGDFGVLVHSGWEKQRALIANYIVAAFVIVGGVAGALLASASGQAVEFLVPIAAGGFLYIAASDLIPELRREENQAKAWLSFVVFLIGVGLMYALTLIEVGH